MVWGAVIGAVGGLLGASASASAASDASDQAAAASAAQLEFDRDRYEDWQATYGGIQDNLSNYYNSLTPDFYEAQGLEAFQQEHQNQLTQVRETLAQRGLSNSGIAAATELSFAHQGATTRAGIRAMAPAAAAEDQLRFLQVGLGQNPGQSMSQTLAQQSAQANQQANQANIVAGQAIGQAINTATTGLSDYFNNRNKGDQE